MFVGNMLGALILLPALAHFLLKPKVIASDLQTALQDQPENMLLLDEPIVCGRNL